MSDHCNQCAKSLGLPEGDMADEALGEPPEGMGYRALCESCGPTIIDHRGNCLSPYCLESHGGSAAGQQWCICADPENCTEIIPGKLCKRVHATD